MHHWWWRLSGCVHTVPTKVGPRDETPRPSWYDILVKKGSRLSSILPRRADTVSSNDDTWQHVDYES